MEQGANINTAVKEVNFLTLELADENGSQQKRTCPVCDEGLLLMGRYRGTWLLMNTDRCTWCGQQFLYLDIPDDKIGDVSELSL